MRSKHSGAPSDDQWPLPLAAKNGELGEAVRAYAQDTAKSSGEAANFASVMGRMEQRPRRISPLALGVAVGALATAAGFVLVAGQLWRGPTTVVASQLLLPPPSPAAPPGASPTPRPAQQPPVASAVPSLRLNDQPAELPTGQAELAGRATATLSADGAASASVRDGVTKIALQRGSVELHVLPQAPGQRLVVEAGHHRFTVVGTVFTVLRAQTRIELRVQEGAVSVSRGSRQLAVVRAGEHWSTEDARPSASTPAALEAEGSLHHPLIRSRPGLSAPSAEVARQPTAIQPPAQAAPTPAPVAVVPAQPAQEDCRQLVASHRAQEAVGCYQKQAMRNGLAGETAAYELARLWRDSLGRSDRAVAAFEEQRARFPSGALRREADLSIIELLPRLGRHADALGETQRFLSGYPRDERTGEIHLLRGNIYREVFRDLSHAEAEYASGSSAKGRAGDDSRFFHAVCLEALGKTEEARAAYQAYLRLRGGAHSTEAKDRLAKIAP